MEDQEEIIIVEGANSGATGLIETPDNEEATREAIEAATPAEPLSAREAAYRYLQENPEEVAHIARAANARNNTQAAELVAPNPDDFDTWEDYFKANNAYMESRISNAVSVAVGGITQQYAPIVGTQAVTMAVDQIAAKFNVPEEAKPFLAENLRGLDPGTIAGLDDTSRRILALAAKGDALERGAMPVARTNGRQLNAVEPVAGVGPLKLELAEGTTRAELDAYLSLTGKQLNRETIADLRKDGYIK